MKIVWTLFGVIGVLLVVATPLGWKWSSDPAHGVAIAYAGVFLSLLGLYVSALGFTLAIHQIAKSRSASQAAEQALISLQSKLSTVSASGEIERARFSLEETERHILDGRSKNVRFSISPARQSLVRIHEMNLSIFSDLGDQIQASISEINTIAGTPDPWDKDISNKNAGLVRSYIDLMNRMQVRVNRG